MRKIKISFVLGILNASRTIDKCLNSIAMQDYPLEECEVLVIDGGSTDNTLKIVESFKKRNKIKTRIMHNPRKLSEGRGMSKDMGVESAKGEIIIFLDHDNILIDKDWLKNILEPFKDKEIWASQSMLKSVKGNSLFLRYINEIGVEDPFAVPYSLLAQIALHPKKFSLKENYYVHELSSKHVLFIGANGCAFRKKVFDIIGGYTRDVDVSASMAKRKMKVAVPQKAKLYHDTSSNLGSFLLKKGKYYYRFINREYKTKEYEWAGSGLSGKLRFFIMVLTNLSLLGPLLTVAPRIFRTGELLWLMHPFYVFYLTLEYGFITLFRIKNFFNYL